MKSHPTSSSRVPHDGTLGSNISHRRFDHEFFTRCRSSMVIDVDNLVAHGVFRRPLNANVRHQHLDDSQKTLSLPLSKGTDMSSSDRYQLRSGVPILSLFNARARPNCDGAL